MKFNMIRDILNFINKLDFKIIAKLQSANLIWLDDAVFFNQKCCAGLHIYFVDSWLLVPGIMGFVG